MKPRTWIRRTALALAGVAIALVASELGTRFYLFGWDALSVRMMRGVHPLGDAGVLAQSPVPELRYTLAPEVEVSFKLATLRTNSRGLRDDELELPKPAGVVRVAVVGDSFTMGSGVELEDCYHSRLEQLADARFPGRTHEFVNFGVGGYGMRHYAALLEHELAAYEPDLVLIGFCASNDHLLSSPPGAGARPFARRPERSGLARSFLRELVKRAYWNWVGGSSGQGSGSGWDEQQIEYVEQQAARIALWQQQSGVPVVFALLALQPLDPKPLETICARHELGFVDATARFERGSRRRYMISPIDSHPNARGHELQAQAIFEHLLAAGLLQP